MSKLIAFRNALRNGEVIADLRSGLIGDGMAFETPFGERNLLYADYVASGRALRQVEDFVQTEVLPFYANSHTEASFCGGTMTRMRNEARSIIGELVGAGPDCHVVFTGSGATSGINRIVGLLRVRERVLAGERVTVLIGPYEHHSNILPWRETGATMVEVPERAEGGPCLAALEAALRDAAGSDLVVGSFSAASNVTGILTNPDPVTQLLKAHGAMAIWDYACGAPYLPMNMGEGNAAKDAIVFSPHKFPGGPGASGVMVIRDTVVQRQTPTAPGGGTVSFVSPWSHTYSSRVEAREEAGTPNVVGDIRAALTLLVKDAVGEAALLQRETELRDKALAAWKDVPAIRLLGQRKGAEALPIFSFRIAGGSGDLVHHQLFTRMLSDVFGVQARGGCACAGSYAHRLLEIDETASGTLFKRLAAGYETEKPGWIRLSLSYLHSNEDAEKIIEAVARLALHAEDLAGQYEVDAATARFRPKPSASLDAVPALQPAILVEQDRFERSAAA
ncbi:aminotransferase class V-fold PLP-dependent enzyme [Tianweitania sp. BSSL-BM11]|uniref:Aminotransferase class V-fold PLP-dependent enzyme n=1 Tax=Tianweitania aestuarii TaxID=2814886 RepID=A0ABS5S017_9HYPH|nr:aminotransferase class V-fold PLP-dependent enzyme [Tianweitania aestuarii]MBS9721242.1 aminotransferase class V-fold PLP-dependent enzyme [Tianweitania aestuarii]